MTEDRMRNSERFLKQHQSLMSLYIDTVTVPFGCSVFLFSFKSLCLNVFKLTFKLLKPGFSELRSVKPVYVDMNHETNYLPAQMF